ncbi:FHA domain-containing protein [Diaminobutyricimonas sp. TR449]|uniref:FHA domain-containing protein n=1 Tax=Diaminobutyricimonas sp. TR449 TaxID=2708076 RepID=UPI001FBBCE32|nr:FHA domain-containing protein [Diaminobutyricimonas sp. TR449]
MNSYDPESPDREPDTEDTILRPGPPDAPGHSTADEDTVLLDPGVFGIRDLEDTVRGSVRGAPTAAARRPEAAPVADHRFRMPDGEEYLLDTPALIGRKPAPPRIAAGPVRLLAVPSPRGEVSSTHIELRASGRAVVVTDLKSTNGTTVSVPGNAQRKLRQGESMVVTPGSLIDIGDGNIVEILPTNIREVNPQPSGKAS